eukprot:m.31556 g.31556  ORF g.31556 m.31556 type:complete len:234 (+) comp12087_c0_seq1:449-1150(+)
MLLVTSLVMRVVVMDDALIVGALYDDDKSNNSGAVYVYQKNSSGQYEQVNKLVASDGSANDLLGHAVAVAGSNSMVAGVPGGEGKGAVCVFEQNSSGFYEQASKLVAVDGAANDLFGWPVATSGSSLLVGAYGDDDKGSLAGAAYVFERNGTGSYMQVQKLVAEDGQADDLFGSTVAISSSLAVVGAYLDDDKGSNSGSVYVYVKNSTNDYTLLVKLVASDRAAFEYLAILLQ